MKSSPLRHTRNHVTSILTKHLFLTICLSTLSHTEAFRVYAGLTGRTYIPSPSSTVGDPPLDVGEEGGMGLPEESASDSRIPPDVQYENLFRQINTANGDLENDPTTDSEEPDGTALNSGIRVNLHEDIWKQDGLDGEMGMDRVSNILRDSQKNLEMLLALKQYRNLKSPNSPQFEAHNSRKTTLEAADKRSFAPPMRHRYGGDVFKIARRRYSPVSAAALAAVARRNSADAHPVYLGMGQEAAEAALDTLAQIIAEDSGRGSREHSKPKETINFIG